MTTQIPSYNTKTEVFVTFLISISHRIQTDFDITLLHRAPTKINNIYIQCRKTTIKTYTYQPSSMKYVKDTTLETIRFPFSSFRYSLTLFSKFFSSFPHGTCSLSVSHLYLALDGIYHLLWAAFPSNPTLWKHILRKHLTGKDGSITLYAALFQGT